MALFSDLNSLVSSTLRLAVKTAFWALAALLIWQTTQGAYNRYQIGLALDDVVPQIKADMGDAEIRGLFAKAMTVREVGAFEAGMLIIRHTQGRVFLFYHSTANLGLPFWELSYPLDLAASAQTGVLRSE